MIKDKTITPRDPATAEVFKQLSAHDLKAAEIPRSGGGYISIRHNDTTLALEYSEDGGATWTAYS